MLKTFKDIQDAVLQWAADQDNDGLLRTLVKDAINQTQTTMLTDQMYDFMLWPKVETINVVSGQTQYALHPLYLQGLYFYNPTTNEYLEEIGPKQTLESGANWQDGTQGEPDRFSLTSITNACEQPDDAATVTVTTASGTEAAANSVVIQGIVDGEYREETLSSGSNWSSITGTLLFEHVIQVIKVGETWTRTITITCDGTTVLTLRSDEFVHECRQLELLSTPSQSSTVQYRFYRRPRVMVYDNEMPEIPSTFVDILKLQTLLQLSGYTRATKDELGLWQAQLTALMTQLQQTYQGGRTLGARSNSVRYIPRY